jgi:hypothetical protein
MAPETLAGIHFPSEVGEIASSVVPLVSDSAGATPSFEVVVSELLNHTISRYSRNLVICVHKAVQFSTVLGVWFKLDFLYRSIH